MKTVTSTLLFVLLGLAACASEETKVDERATLNDDSGADDDSYLPDFLEED